MLINEIKIPLGIEKIADKIVADCQPFLRAIGHDVTNKQLWRGLERNDESLIKVVKCPIGRHSMNTDDEVHEAADEYFLENFGVRYRSNTFFVTGSEQIAAEYGSERNGIEYMLFPIGPFRFCWSPEIFDFFNDIGSEYEAEYIDKICGNSGYQTTNLTAAIASGNEIMLHCPKAYLVNGEYILRNIKAFQVMVNPQ